MSARPRVAPAGGRWRVVFFGSPAFAVPSLEAVARQHEVVGVLTQPDRPAGRGKKLTTPAVKECAMALGLRVEQPSTLKDAALEAELLRLSPDLFVVVAYGRILPPAMLAIPRFGCWNVHASLLPKLRGAAPIQWSIMRGDRATGVSIMRMEAGLDTGPLAAQARIAIEATDTASTLAAKLAPLGAQLLVETLPKIAVSGAQATLVPQDHAQATLAPLLKKEDGELDFARPAALVSAQARGVDPWPGATALLGNERAKLFVPTVVSGVEGRNPGEVLGLGAPGLTIACAQGAIAFAELQLPGHKRLPAAAVLAGFNIPTGTIARGKV